jgi:hypothetical protein
MSLTKVEIRPVVGSALELNTQDGSGNHLFPLSEFNIETAIDTSGNAKRMAESGEWPTFHYPGAMAITAQGRILGIGGSDASRAIDYITKRLAFLDAVLPPLGFMTSRKHAVLRVRFDGMTEDADADVVCIQQSIPLAALYPAQSEFMVTWKGFLPYFVGTSSSTKYQLG